MGVMRVLGFGQGLGPDDLPPVAKPATVALPILLDAGACMNLSGDAVNPASIEAGKLSPTHPPIHTPTHPPTHPTTHNHTKTRTDTK